MPGTLTKHLPHLRAVLDSGAGVSLGALLFFKDLNERFPQLVHKFAEINPEVHAEIMVGNIDKHCPAASCTHFIELYTPFTDQGQPVTWRIALSAVMSVNCLMGLPFIVKSKMVTHFAEGYAHSGLFQTNFDLEYRTPVLQDSVPLQDGQATPAFVSQQVDPINQATNKVTVLDPNNSKATDQ